jgi:hypothetical protein
MSELDWAERFSHDVDALLRGYAPDRESAPPPEYRQALDLARTLATANLAAESRTRQAVRARLLARATGAPARARGGAMGGWAFWRPALVILSLAMTALILLSMMTLAPAQGTPSPSPAQVATRPSTGQPAFGQPAAPAQPAVQGTLPVQPAPVPTPREAATQAMRGGTPDSPARAPQQPAVANPSAFAAVGTVPLRGLLNPRMTFADMRSTPAETWVATQVPTAAGGQ